MKITNSLVLDLKISTELLITKMREDVTLIFHEVDAHRITGMIQDKVYFLCLLLTVRWVKEDRAGGRAEREIELGERECGRD